MKNDLEKELNKLNAIIKEQDDMYAFKIRPYPIKFIELNIDDIDRNEKLKQ